DLEIELHVLHVERHVLLGLPADNLAHLSLAHTVHGDLLDDHVAAAHCGDHVLCLDPRRGEKALDGIGDKGWVHHLALDDCVAHHRGERNLGEDWLPGAMRDGDELDQPASDIQGHGGRVATEQCHRCPSVFGVEGPTLLYHCRIVNHTTRPDQLIRARVMRYLCGLLSSARAAFNSQDRTAVSET